MPRPHRRSCFVSGWHCTGGELRASVRAESAFHRACVLSGALSLTSGLRTALLWEQNTALSYVCLDGNQARNFADFDTPYCSAKFSVWDKAMSEEQIKAVVATK